MNELVGRSPRLAILGVVISAIGCEAPAPQPNPAPSATTAKTDVSTAAPKAPAMAAPAALPVNPDTCKGPYANYWQDPAFAAEGMWEGQKITDQPPADWKGPVFKLGQKFPTALVDDASARGWMKFDPFKAGLSQEEKSKQARGYIDAIMEYVQAGNTGAADTSQDFSLCNNKVRNWYHMPFQTYDPGSGREFIHGLTREAPVTFTLAGGKSVATTVWAVGFFNAAASYVLGQTWKADGTLATPSKNMSFPEGAVIGKLLFTTATPKELPFLENLPTWQANISDPAFCKCKPKDPKESQCSFVETSEQCPRTLGSVTLMQFDVAVRDKRAKGGWAFGTFVADGKAKKDEKNPWMRISPLGLMWGNDTPPEGKGALEYPVDPSKNGFAEEVVFADVVARLNEGSNAGHLGCDGRLNGPADNARSSCLSCHQTASVPDKNLATPPIFMLSGSSAQCANPAAPATDAVYFASMPCASSFQGGTVVAPPQYASGAKDWISTDFSLQVSIAMVQYNEWVTDRAATAETPTGPAVAAVKLKSPAKPARRPRTTLPAR